MHSHFHMTTWENPTKHEQRFLLHAGPGADPMEVVIQPGDTANVLAIYDDAICTVRNGVVVGGLAPLLVAKGRVAVPVHDAIAKAATLGDAERKLIAATGSSAGGSSLEPMVALEQKNRELEAKVDLLSAMMAGHPGSPAVPAPAAGPAPSGKPQPTQNQPGRG